MSSSDAGFCSGGSENGDDLTDHSRDGPRSPTSEDSVEVKVLPICIPKNKRKSTEPLRLVTDTDLGPIKKRIRYNETIIKEENDTNLSDNKNPFRPWAPASQDDLSQHIPNPAEVFLRHPGVTTLHRASSHQQCQNIQEQPLALVSKKVNPFPVPQIIPIHTLTSKMSPQSSPSIINHQQQMIYQHQLQQHQQNLQMPITVPQPPPSVSESSTSQGRQNQQRNYKNMTRERRVEANARERTRVHTISAAYDTLRKSIPSYSHNQKLSKLSVLRISCNYILMLSRVLGNDYSYDNSEPSILDCVEQLTKTIQTEGKLRKKKDE